MSSSLPADVCASPREEIVLPGGDINHVVRVADTVRRLTGPWTGAVHSLLRHYEAAGFAGAPSVLGFDAQGREVLRFIEGEAGLAPVPAGDEVVSSLGRLLRAAHDAQAGFARPPDARWQAMVGVPDHGTVVCHHDLFWPNVIFRGGEPVALIDWDLAAPSPPLYDVASAAYHWAPCQPDDEARRWGLPVDRRGERLRLLSDAYGLDGAGRAGLLDAVAEQIEIGLATYRVWGRDERRRGWAELVEQGGEARLERQRRWFASERDGLAPYLA